MSPGFCLCKTGNTNTNTQAVPGKVSGPLLPGGPWEQNCPFLPVTFAPPARSPEEQVVTLESWLLGSTTGTLGQ